MTLEERFWAHVEQSGECAVWTGQRLKRGEGHGRFYVSRRVKVLAHRFAFERERGRIPEGMCVLHRCDNPPCVRIDHLFLGTQIDNIADRQAKGRQRTQWRFAPDEVRTIRRRSGDGESQTELAREFGVNPGTISRLVRRETYA